MRVRHPPLLVLPLLLTRPNTAFFACFDLPHVFNLRIGSALPPPSKPCRFVFLKMLSLSFSFYPQFPPPSAGRFTRSSPDFSSQSQEMREFPCSFRILAPCLFFPSFPAAQRRRFPAFSLSGENTNDKYCPPFPGGCLRSFLTSFQGAGIHVNSLFLPRIIWAFSSLSPSPKGSGPFSGH